VYRRELEGKYGAAAKFHNKEQYMASVNKVILVGNLGRDPAHSQVKRNTVTS
jgi:hypothetical protein